MTAKRTARQVSRSNPKRQLKRVASSGDLPSWEQRLKELKAFEKQHGHCNVPRLYPANPVLAGWVANLRQRKKRGMLAEDKIRILDALGFCWDRGAAITRATEAAWKQHVHDLKSFKKEHGHCDVPIHYPPNRPLGTWVNFTRNRKKAGKLAKERIRCLEEANYAALIEFRKEYGHCRVSTLSRTHAALANWVRTQRLRKKQGKLSAERIRRLDSLGFTWDMSTCRSTPTVKIP